MASKNLVILIGHLARDPEIKFFDSGNSVCNFTVATTKKYVDKSKEKQEKTQWHNITAWGKLAEICGQYLKKGSSVYIEGRIEYEKYEKDGVEKYITKIVASSMQMLGGKGKEPAESAPESGNSDLPF